MGCKCIPSQDPKDPQKCKKYAKTKWILIKHLITLIAEPPGKVIDLKLTSSNYSTFSLAWTKPTVVKGVEDEAQGYYVEIRLIENLEWTRCNANQITLTSFNVLGLKAMAAYWVRVIATNYGGNGEPQGFDSYIIAMPPPGKPVYKNFN